MLLVLLQQPVFQQCIVLSIVYLSLVLSALCNLKVLTFVPTYLTRTFSPLLKFGAFFSILLTILPHVADVHHDPDLSERIQTGEESNSLLLQAHLLQTLFA